MSFADDAIRQQSAAFDAVHADVWRILGTGQYAGYEFQADAQTEAPMVLDTDLGSDAREKTMLFVAYPAPAHVLGLKRNTILTGKGSMWRVVGDIDDNPANYRVKFEVVKIVPGKDSP